MAIKEELIDQLLADYQKPEDIIGENSPAQATDEGSAGASTEG